MDLTTYLKNHGCLLLITLTICCALSSCNGYLYEDEGDCDVTYRVKFRYDRNMKWADAFAHEVKSVHLYAFDKSGTLVWQQTDKGEALATEGYTMTLGLPAGDYKLLAWCGLENDGKRSESFSVPEARVGETRIEELQCRLNRKHDAGGAYTDENLYPLFHGMMDVSLPATDDGGDYTYPMYLTKDTNHVRIILQHLSGEPVDYKEFTFRIEEENGFMDFNNSLLPDEMITYRPYAVTTGTTGLGIDDYSETRTAESVESSRAIESVKVAVADITTARLMENRKTFLTVETTEGMVSARIPLTDYALMLKPGYDEEISDQDYLDRQDEYALTFFLDENRKWIGTSIIINSWKLVLNDVGFGN